MSEQEKCKGGCGFFGSANRDGYCSQCGPDQAKPKPAGFDNIVAEIPEGEYNCQYNTLTGKKVPFTANADMTLMQLADIIHDNEGFPKDIFRIIYSGYALYDGGKCNFGNLTFREMHIGKGSVIHIVIMLRGD